MRGNVATELRSEDETVELEIRVTIKSKLGPERVAKNRAHVAAMLAETETMLRLLKDVKDPDHPYQDILSVSCHPIFPDSRKLKIA